MKIIVERQYNELGGEYLNQDEVEMEIRKYNEEIIIEMDGSMYSIPIEVFKGLLSRSI